MMIKTTSNLQLISVCRSLEEHLVYDLIPYLATSPAPPIRLISTPFRLEHYQKYILGNYACRATITSLLLTTEDVADISRPDILKVAGLPFQFPSLRSLNVDRFIMGDLGCLYYLVKNLPATVYTVQFRHVSWAHSKGLQVTGTEVYTNNVKSIYIIAPPSNLICSTYLESLRYCFPRLRHVTASITLPTATVSIFAMGLMTSPARYLEFDQMILLQLPTTAEQITQQSHDGSINVGTLVLRNAVLSPLLLKHIFVHFSLLSELRLDKVVFLMGLPTLVIDLGRSTKFKKVSIRLLDSEVLSRSSPSSLTEYGLLFLNACRLLSGVFVTILTTKGQTDLFWDGSSLSSGKLLAKSAIGHPTLVIRAKYIRRLLAFTIVSSTDESGDQWM